MDKQRFDRLSRYVGKQTTRRGAFKAAAGGSLALLGLGAVSRTAAAALTGFEDDPCVTNAECRAGLFCQGGSTGILGGSLAGIPYGPPGISLPVLTGRTGSCRYSNGCGNEGQACRRTDDCCGDDLECNNNHCRRRN